MCVCVCKTNRYETTECYFTHIFKIIYNTI